MDSDLVAKAKRDIIKNINRVPFKGKLIFIFEQGELKDIVMKERVKRLDRKISYGKVTKTFQNDNVVDIIVEERKRIKQ